MKKNSRSRFFCEQPPYYMSTDGLTLGFYVQVGGPESLDYTQAAVLWL